MLRADSKQSVSRSHYCDLAENRSQNLRINETGRLNRPAGGNANSPIDFQVLPLFTLHFQLDGKFLRSVSSIDLLHTPVHVDHKASIRPREYEEACK